MADMSGTRAPLKLLSEKSATADISGLGEPAERLVDPDIVRRRLFSDSAAARPRGPSESSASEADRLERSSRNPFSRDGAVTRLAERVPVINNAVQGIHKLKGHDEALERARQRNPLRKDGRIAAAAEHMPVVNNVIQEVYKHWGTEEDYERARERNPFGHAGYITQAGEHIPGVADAIRCIHKYRGHTEDAERARAYSLRKLVGKHGAVTKLAELLPGTNLLAALVLEVSGDREEAVKALNFVRQVKDAGTADGALAKLAELFPGTDIIAFGLQCSNGHYASALRTICKTRWVEISSKSTVLVISANRIGDWLVLDVTSDLELQPKVRSLAAGLTDIGIHLMDFNRHGERRTSSLFRKHKSVRGGVQDAKVDKANDALQGGIASLNDQVVEYCGWGVDLANWSVYEWEPSTSFSKTVMRALYVLFPPMPFKPPPSTSHGAALATTIQDSLPDVTVYHAPMPLNPETFSIPTSGRHLGKRARCLPEAATAVSCLSFVGCLGFGWHTGPLACLAGCTAGLSAMHREVKSNLVPWLNKSNAAVHEWMSAPPMPSRRFTSHGSRSSNSLPTPMKPRLSGRSNSGGSGRFSEFVSPQSSSKSVMSSSKSAKRQPSPPSEGVAKPRRSSSGGFAQKRRDSEAAEEKDERPWGITLDWSPELVRSMDGGRKVRDYFMDEFCTLRRPLNWLHPMCLVLGLFEEQLRTFLNDAFDGEAVPLAIPIPLPEGMYEGIETWLPEIRVMLILWFRFTDRSYVTGVRVALVDGMIDQVANVVTTQCLPSDLRELDPRLADFTEPIHLDFDIALQWATETRLKLEINNLRTKLHLPL